MIQVIAKIRYIFNYIFPRNPYPSKPNRDGE